MPMEKYGWAIQKSLFARTNQDILADLTINQLQAELRI